MNLALLRGAWPQTGDWQSPQTLTRGTNNAMYRVETTTGVYALRLAGPQVTPRRLRFEHDVMTQLADSGLPYALPIALPTAQGDLYARVTEDEVGEAGATLAILTRFIAGEHPQRADLAQAEAAGEALGLLSSARASVTPADDSAAQDWRSSGDLTRCHALVPDPRAAFAELPLTVDERARLIQDYDTLVARIPSLYARLPSQMSHEDYDPSNVLMAGERVTGVLDFEFCARDLRPMDLAVALTWWPVERYGTGDEWPIIAALLRGYGRHVTLTADETAAIPLLFRFRAYSSLIHRLGRWRAGLNPREHVLWRATAALERADWLSQNGERLIQSVDEALR